VPLKDYYQLLQLPPTATAEEIKKAFRQQIAKYHPDKVQHLGQEFQEMAAGRAAELTEAYRILSDEGRRAEYDRQIAAEAGATADVERPPQGRAAEPARPASQATRPGAAESAGPHTAPPPPPPPSEPEAPRGSRFTQERASRDAFVRKALVGRVRQALDVVAGGYDTHEVRGFDVALNPKKKLFGGTKGPHLLVRFVETVNGDSITDAWTQAAKAFPTDDVCVFLMGSGIAPAGELAAAIAEQRRKTHGKSKVTLIPVDSRDWDARIPTDAPPVVRTLLTRLRTGA